jgi:Zn2+/Cd2+-exporting ATPase
LKSSTFNEYSLQYKRRKVWNCSDSLLIETTQSTMSIRFIHRHWQPALSMCLLLSGLILDYLLHTPWFSGSVRLVWYLIAYLPVGLPVLRQGVRLIVKGDLFTEFFLMGIATIGAFLIGEYPEAVAVMLFYSIGEAFQHNAVHNARRNIKSLLDVRPDVAHVLRGESVRSLHPSDVEIGETIRVRPGERIPLDGLLLNDRAALETSALTGESKPRHFTSEETVLAGMINLHRTIEIRVTSSYDRSSISRILELVESAAARKAKTELFIRSFARVYTPFVVALAFLLVLLPYFFIADYQFEDWLYRGLVFLVISCPCALVISIPLGYYGGIGAASRNGILVKGGNFLDALRSVDTVVFDKTGTLTEGTFTVQHIQPVGRSEMDLLSDLIAIESGSNHPIARALIDYADELNLAIGQADEIRETPGSGIEGHLKGRHIMAGSERWLVNRGINIRQTPDSTSESVVHIAVDREHAGYVVIADRIKEDTMVAVKELRELGVKRLIMLSGDRKDVAERVGRELGLDQIHGELLPGDKAAHLESIMSQSEGYTAYAGDGINDAPVLARSDVGIAMGALGSDVAIETADVVIQTDQPGKIATAIRIGKATRSIVWQNISLALGVKLLVLGLGALGMATLWEAVFADVGVALLAILNAIRIQKMTWQ